MLRSPGLGVNLRVGQWPWWALRVGGILGEVASGNVPFTALSCCLPQFTNGSSDPTSEVVFLLGWSFYSAEKLIINKLHEGSGDCKVTIDLGL